MIAASGTLAQIIPPSLVLIVLADQLGRSVGDMYKGAFIPGFMLTGLYALYVLGRQHRSGRSGRRRCRAEARTHPRGRRHERPALAAGVLVVLAVAARAACFAKTAARRHRRPTS